MEDVDERLVGRVHAETNPALRIPFDACFSFFVDSASRREKSFFDVLGSLGRSFQEFELMLLGKLSAFIVRHGPARIKIALIADQDFHDVFIRELLTVFKPAAQVFERFTSRNIVDKESSSCASIV